MLQDVHHTNTWAQRQKKHVRGVELPDKILLVPQDNVLDTTSQGRSDFTDSHISFITLWLERKQVGRQYVG